MKKLFLLSLFIFYSVLSGLAQCAPPTDVNVNPNNVTTTSASVTWAASGSSVSNYVVSYKPTGSGSSFQTVTVASTQTTCTLSDLTSSTDYVVYVHSVCSSTNSIYSSAVYFRTASACNVPLSANVNPNNVTTTTAPVTWSAPSGSVSGYVISYKISGSAGNSFQTVSVSSSQLSYTLTGLTSGETYVVYVHTECGTVNSEYSNAVYFTTDDGSSPSCEPPTSLATDNLTETSVDFIYSPVAASTNYEIAYRAEGATTWTSMYTTATTASPLGLLAGTYYEWRVRSYCSGSWSTTWSTIQNFNTPCPTAKDPHLNFVTENSAEVDWTEVKIGSEWSDFNVYYRVLETSEWTSAFESGYDKLLLENLQTNTPYEWCVETVCPSGALSFKTTPQIFTTSLLAPVADFSMSASIINEGETVNFTDASTNEPVVYAWTFDGGTPASSTNQTPGSITFDNPGYYDITLQVTNASGTSSKTKKLKVMPVGSTSVSVNEARNRNYPLKKDGDPVNTATGEYTWGHEDMIVKGMGMSFPWRRYYASRADYDKTLGWNWNHNYDIHLTIEPYEWTVHNGDGSESVFIPYENGSSMPLHLFSTDTMYYSGGIYILEKTNGTQYLFSDTGTLDSIWFPSGHAVRMEYTSGNVSKITFPGGRYFTLAYTSDKLTSVSDNAGRTVYYVYDGNGDLIQATNVRSGMTQYNYDAQHQITSIIDPLGNTVVANTYDASSRVTNQVDAYDKETTFQYNIPVDSATTVTHPNGTATVYFYDGKYRLIRKKDKAGNDSYYEYHAESNSLTKVTDEKGRISTFEVDTHGNTTKADFPMGVSSTSVFNTQNLPYQIINPLGDTTHITYNAFQNPKYILFPDNSGISIAYNTNQQIDTVYDKKNNATVYKYNSFGDVVKIKTSTGDILFSYNDFGLVDTVQDRNGNKTAYEYDYYGNVVKVTDALGLTTSMTYDANGNLVSLTNTNNVETKYFYDARDRLIRVRDSLEHEIYYRYDALDKLLAVKNTLGDSVTYTYNDLGQVLSISSPLDSVSYAYDDAGNPISITDVLNRTTTIRYDSLDRPTTYIDALNDSIQLFYDKSGQVTAIVNPSKDTTTYLYDKIGRLLSVKDPLDGKNTFAYDVNGNLLSLTDANEHITQAQYDARDLLISKTTPGGYIYSYTYDNEGNLIQITKPNGETTTYVLDDIYRITSEQHSNGETYDFTYNSLGQFSSMSNSNGTTDFHYNVLGWLIDVTDPFGNTVQYEYDALGRRTNTIYPGNNSVKWEYNSAGLVSKITDWKGNWSTRAYDELGNISNITHSNGTSLDIEYDNLGRSTSWLNKGKDNQVFHSNILNYNTQGNISQDNGIKPLLPDFENLDVANTYDADDCLTTSGANTFAFGANGTLSAISGGRNESYTWGENNLLLAYTRNGVSTQNKYNPMGVRIKRVANAIETRYTQDLGLGLNQVLEERNTNNQRTSAYIYAPDGLCWRLDSSGNAQFYHFDYAGHTIALTDSVGTITDTLAVAPFGDFFAHHGNTQQPFAFLGRYGIMQELSALYHIRARFYDAHEGRFISQDAFPANLLNTQSVNRFAYSLNNPVNLMDVSGFFSEDILGYPQKKEVSPNTGIVNWNVRTDYYEDSKNVGIKSFNRSFSYTPPPRTLNGFPDARRVRPKGGRPRWKLPNGDIIEWDGQHGDLERYDKSGKKHKGSWDPQTGGQTKPKIPGRKTPKYLGTPNTREAIGISAIIVGGVIIVFDIVTVPSGEGLIGVEMIRRGLAQ